MMKKIFLTALLASICFSGLWAQQFHAKMGASFVTLNENGEDIGPGTYATYFGFGFEVPFVPKSRQRVSLKTVDRSSSIFTADYWNKLIKGEGFVDTIRTVYYDRRKIHFTLTPELMFNYGRTYQMWGDVRNSYKINQMLFPIVVKYYPFGYRDRSMAKGLSLQLVPMGTYMMGFKSRLGDSPEINLKKERQVNSVGFNLGAGLGYTFGWYGFDFRYTWGMTDVYFDRKSRIDLLQITFVSLF